jgi:SAM-dependent methyltransferase
MSSILEIGSMDVNGSLRSHAPKDAQWTGVDLETGPGVDVVVEAGKPLPFEDSTFDLVLATSVLEHDPKFWQTISEMARVAKPNGLIYLNAPSGGVFHRYPLDHFRFYPDAGIAFLEIIRQQRPQAILRESFIANQDTAGFNDFVAVYALDGNIDGEQIWPKESVSNVWSNGVFQEETLVEQPEFHMDLHLARLELEHTRTELEKMTKHYQDVVNSKTWRYLERFRKLLFR